MGGAVKVKGAAITPLVSSVCVCPAVVPLQSAQECQDVLQFLTKWVGPPSNPAFSFK